MKKNTCDTTSRDKWWWPGGKHSISTRRSSGVSALISVTLLTGLLSLSLILNRCEAALPEPVKRVVVIIKMEMFATQEDVSEVCMAALEKAGASIAPGRTAAGCATPLSRGMWKLQLKQPTSWCEWMTVKTWGHELMHAAGYHHSKAHAFYGGSNRWTGENCGLVDE